MKATRWRRFAIGAKEMARITLRFASLNPRQRGFKTQVCNEFALVRVDFISPLQGI